MKKWMALKMALVCALLAGTSEAQFLQNEKQFAADLLLQPVAGQTGVYKNKYYKAYVTSKKGLVTGASFVFNGEMQFRDLSSIVNYLFDDLYFEEERDLIKEWNSHVQNIRSRDGYSFTDDSLGYQLNLQGKDSKSYVLKMNLISRDLKSFPEDAVVYGDPAAKVSVQIFSDFQCPACKMLSSEVLEKWKTTLPAQGVNIKYYHYPLDYHKNANPAALASECARDQGKFWEYAEYLFETTGWLRKTGNDLTESLIGLANRTGLDAAAFKTCYETAQHQDRIDQHIKAGDQVKVWGTPSVYVNGVPFGNWDDFSRLGALIQLAK
ncbi:DsbA family protein [Deinococcus cellulosilyticus]|uniref:Thioredoxin-like fold domain-containing protein n=1 Tax=Deinococcus cellulosilyticus (strain DSM 18568 / NBRC 106333 / KACC 11606 / 5516J-15) TaxID=1223518 RepID=A0A511N161_DEIC1|nr:DsbA family protein [Deinococcus cellulosilyticus]GEM46610.1 hypothetical protein DC3_22450 [Deinococcus cellulosilyticus NBRC 106333 = KACC 11606]